MRVRNNIPYFVIIILLIVFAVGLYHIQSQSIWFDEGWSAYSAIQPTLQSAINSDKTNPPLYYVIVHIVARGIGDSELALRWVSLAFGMAAVSLAYQLARRLFTPHAGLLAALLLVVSPLMWWAGQEARMYTLLAVLVLLCALAWHHLLAASWRGWRGWLLLCAGELAMLYAHNTGPVVALWLNAVTLAAVMSSKLQVSSNTLKDANRQSLLILSPQPSVLSTLALWFVSQAIVGLLWLPYFINRFLNLTEANSALNSTTPLTLESLGRLWQSLWTGTWAMVGREPLLVGFSALAFGLAVLLIPWRKANARWLVLHVILLTGGLWLALSLLGNEVHGRYLVMIAPLLLVVMGGGLARLPSYLAGVGVVLFGLAFAAALHFTTTNPAYQHDDARGMVRYYADHLTAADSVLMWSYADRYELAYYWDRLGVQAERITLPEGADLDAVLPLLPTSGDVALNVWYTQRADYRGMMGCLLGDGTVNEPERFDVYGMTDVLFRAPALNPPALVPFEASLSMAAITAVGDIRPAPADRAICLPIQLTLTQPTTVDLKAAVVVRNTFGQPIAQTDAIFADRVQRLSSSLPAGTVLTAYALLRLPYGAPAGDYTLSVRVYDEVAQPAGYSLTLPDGQTRGDVVLSFSRSSGSDWEAVNRSTDLPVQVDIAVPDMRLALLAHNLQDSTYRNGDTVNLALLWRGEGQLPNLQLVAEDGTWQVGINAPDVPNRDSITLDWRRVQIPLDAGSGSASLQFADGTPLASITVESIPALYEAPPYDTAVNTVVPAIGTLVGYTVSGDMGDRSQPFTLDLIWQAELPTAISYTVFVQLVADDGRVLAQSDSLPAGGSRPTTGWRGGEYLVDTHTVNFHADASTATASLIVGLYDAATGQRVPVSATTDTITLATGIAVR
ncbi:MAG: glycosyltransferase family 39 protein [Chloroflexi bacterium]|nr:glycosyltransferase family 39 protein [Chloroflexota bacterium]MCC6897240.1 glycosyltransferase family 39 protein [Anaerolineae bacterium]